jgi:hypothetical protein
MPDSIFFPLWHPWIKLTIESHLIFCDETLFQLKRLKEISGHEYFSKLLSFWHALNCLYMAHTWNVLHKIFHHKFICISVEFAHTIKIALKPIHQNIEDIRILDKDLLLFWVISRLVFFCYFYKDVCCQSVNKLKNTNSFTWQPMYFYG